MRPALVALLLALPATPPAPALSQNAGVASDGPHSFVWANGDIFSGEFRNGLPNGPGTFRTATGLVHSGEWRDGCLVSAAGYRVAVFTALRNCPPPPRPRRPPLPRPFDFR